MSEKFAGQMRQLRKKKRMSQQLVADLCGISKSSVLRYECGERTPNLETAAMLADLFGVTINYLCGK